jgi:hypothetical protein
VVTLPHATSDRPGQVLGGRDDLALVHTQVHVAVGLRGQASLHHHPERAIVRGERAPGVGIGVELAERAQLASGVDERDLDQHLADRARAARVAAVRAGGHGPDHADRSPARRVEAEGAAAVVQVLAELLEGDARLHDHGLPAVPRLELAQLNELAERDHAAVRTEALREGVPGAASLDPLAAAHERLHGTLHLLDRAWMEDLGRLGTAREVAVEARGALGSLGAVGTTGRAALALARRARAVAAREREPGEAVLAEAGPGVGEQQPYPDRAAEGDQQEQEHRAPQRLHERDPRTQGTSRCWHAGTTAG